MKHESVITEFVEANGLRFEVDKCGSGDTLVMCLHGFPEHAISWRHQMPMLADMGYTVWAPNQRGYGLSDIPKGVANYSIDKLTEDIGALFDASGCKDMILMGHDWGAVIAWSFAIGQVRPLKRLIIANVPHPNAMRRELAENKEQKKKSWYITAFQIPWLPEFVMRRNNAKAVVGAILNTSVNKENFPPEIVDIYRQNALRKGGLTKSVGVASAALANEEYVEAMGAIASLRGPVDAFFDNVTVNTDDADTRANRLRLLSQIRSTLDQVADFSQIEG